MILKGLSYLNGNNYILGLHTILRNVIILVGQPSESPHLFLKDFLIGRRTSKNFRYKKRVMK